jgi:hypothetical protein
LPQLIVMTRDGEVRRAALGRNPNIQLQIDFGIDYVM